MTSPEGILALLRHRPREHASVRTRQYIYSQLISYIGNKRRLLPLIASGIAATGCRGGTAVSRWRS